MELLLYRTQLLKRVRGTKPHVIAYIRVAGPVIILVVAHVEQDASEIVRAPVSVIVQTPVEIIALLAVLQCVEMVVRLPVLVPVQVLVLAPLMLFTVVPIVTMLVRIHVRTRAKEVVLEAVRVVLVNAPVAKEAVVEVVKATVKGHVKEVVPYIVPAKTLCQYQILVSNMKAKAK